MEPALYDLIYAGLASSVAYRDVLAEISFDLPEWVVPLSTVDRPALERMAGAMRLRSGDTFVDLACGLGGPGIWIAERTGASVVGVDFSRVAIAEAEALAAERGMSARARFVVADAAETGLPTAAFAAVACIDSLQFVEPVAGTVEIARLLAPGGVAVVTTWEALTDVELPTVVRDYEPFFSSAGLAVTRHEIVEGARARELTHYRAVLEHADRLREEMHDAAEPLLHEAQSGLRREHDPPRVRKVFIVARKAGPS